MFHHTRLSKKRRDALKRKQAKNQATLEVEKINSLNTPKAPLLNASGNRLSKKRRDALKKLGNDKSTGQANILVANGLFKSATQQSVATANQAKQINKTVSSPMMPILHPTLSAEGFCLNGFPISLSGLPSLVRKNVTRLLGLLVLLPTTMAYEAFKQQFFSIANATIRLDSLKTYAGFATSPTQQVANCDGVELDFTPSGVFDFIYQTSRTNSMPPGPITEVVEKLFLLAGNTLTEEVKQCLFDQMDHSSDLTDNQRAIIMIAWLASLGCCGIITIGVAYYFVIAKGLENKNATLAIQAAKRFLPACLGGKQDEQERHLTGGINSKLYTPRT